MENGEGKTAAGNRDYWCSDADSQNFEELRHKRSRKKNRDVQGIFVKRLTKKDDGLWQRTHEKHPEMTNDGRHRHHKGERRARGVRCGHKADRTNSVSPAGLIAVEKQRRRLGW